MGNLAYYESSEIGKQRMDTLRGHGAKADEIVRMMYALRKLGLQKHGFVRPPYQPLDASERSKIDQALARSGFL